MQAAVARAAARAPRAAPPALRATTARGAASSSSAPPQQPPAPPPPAASGRWFDRLIPEDDPALAEFKARERRVIKEQLGRGKLAEAMKAPKEKVGGGEAGAGKGERVGKGSGCVVLRVVAGGCLHRRRPRPLLHAPRLTPA
jgi:hypothetical protein